MLKKLLFSFTNSNCSLALQQSKCLIHINNSFLLQSNKNTSGKEPAKNEKTSKANTDFEDFQEPSKYLNLKQLDKLGLLKDKWIWPKYNRIIYPPQAPDEPKRNAFVHHMKNYIKYPAKKLWFPAVMIRGQSIDEAIKQLSFQKSKGAYIIKEVLLEAQQMAVKDHNVEFKSNLWVAQSHVNRAVIVKGIRRHMGGRFGIINYRYSHYFVRLEEGPPEKYETTRYESLDDRSKKYIEYLRSRKIHYLN